MTVQLDDPRRVRALTRACRRAAARTRPWWHWGRRRASSSNRDVVRQVAMRLALTGIIAIGGAIAVHPLTVQLLALAGIILMQARITKLRTLLGGEAALAVLAQFPITDRTIFLYQVRQRWRSALFGALDAAVFWSFSWQTQQGSVPWHWLPLVAATHALVTEGLALLLLRVWPTQGLLLTAAAAAAMCGTLRQDERGWLWSATEPVLQACAWLTPWGWSNTLAAQLPERPHLAVPLLALGALAAFGNAWIYARLQRTWVLDPAWREIAGRPVHTLHDLDDIDDEHTPDPVASAGAIDAEAEGPAASHAPLDSADRALRDKAALTDARNSASGERMRAFGWAGRRALASWDAEARWLVDRLAPQAAGSASWRWALLFAALPAAVGVLGVSPSWVPAVLALILVVRRMPRRAVLAGAVFGCTVLWPRFTHVVGIGLPCATALLMSHPILGGAWHGLPMGSTVLGNLPRRWSLMMRIMLTFTGLRLLAGVPIMALVLLAVGYALEPGLAAIVAAAWVVVALSVPWVSALRLIQRTSGGIDMSLGRALLTVASTCCVLVYALAAVLLTLGVHAAVTGGSRGMPGLVMTAAAIGISMVTSAVHLVMLRRAYRTSVDLIPPA